MSDTPETDAEAIEVGWGHFMADADFAKRLERERDEARKLADSYRIAFCSANGMDKAPNPFPWEESK
jgi:hypothetical protein